MRHTKTFVWMFCCVKPNRGRKQNAGFPRSSSTNGDSRYHPFVCRGPCRHRSHGFHASLSAGTIIYLPSVYATFSLCSLLVLSALPLIGVGGQDRRAVHRNMGSSVAWHQLAPHRGYLVSFGQCSSLVWRLYQRLFGAMTMCPSISACGVFYPGSVRFWVAI